MQAFALVSLSQAPQVVRIIAAIRDDGCSFADIWFKALASLRNIGPVTCGEAETNGFAAPITDQMQLAVQPAFCLTNGPPAPFVFLTPFAAVRWVLLWLASIMRVERSALSRARVSNTLLKTPASDQRL